MVSVTSWVLPMFPIHNLRFRVAFYFALLGAGLSLALSVGVYFAGLKISNRLIDEALHAELEDAVVRHERNPAFIPPDTLSIKGYVLADKSSTGHIPAEIIALPTGTRNIVLRQTNYRILVEERGDARFFLMFEIDSQFQEEQELLQFLIIFALSMTLASAGIGYWLALRIIAPVTRLANLVSQAEPGDVNLSLGKLTRNDEVGELARAFDRYIRRLQDFIEREGYFTADVSHELRTPLAVILGSVEVLEQDGALSERQRMRIERIRRAVQDMTDLTHALLLMAREHTSSTADLSCNAGIVVSDCVQKHQSMVEDRPVTLSVELAASYDLYVERPLLEIVINNLIRNAVFNTESGTISVRLEQDRLIVKDTGSGMGPEELAHAMERHYKGPSSAGSGLGLSLVKRICDRYSWSITLTSSAGLGSTAEVLFTSYSADLTV